MLEVYPFAPSPVSGNVYLSSRNDNSITGSDNRRSTRGFLKGLSTKVVVSADPIANSISQQKWNIQNRQIKKLHRRMSHFMLMPKSNDFTKLTHKK